jgi:predicted ATPase
VALHPPPYLSGLYIVPERIPPAGGHPYSLGFVEGLDLTFSSAVAIFVGENGSGKSTLLEAIAVLAGLPISGGACADRDAAFAPEQRGNLADVLRPSFRKRPHDGYFLRAEFQAYYASLLDARAEDPEFTGNPYALYGGSSLHAKSHGEAFLAVIQNRFEKGLYLLDEPEAALSPQRQLALLALMHALVSSGHAQFILATHSPILMTYPEAEILSFDDPALPRIRLEETSHYQITKGILENPARYWKHLLARD